MNKIFATILAVFLVVTASAQLTPEERIQDSVIGWWSNNQYDHLKPQTDPVAKKKEANLNKMVEWMKKSYIPVGGLGTTSRYISKYSYGVNGLVWNVSHDKMWTDAKGNFRPIPEENTKFYMVANIIYGASDSRFLSSTDEWYLTVEPDGYGSSNDEVKYRNGFDPRIHPNAYKYLTWINDMHTVYLAPGNKLPMIPVTRGELLDRAEASINDRFLADKRKEKEGYWPGNTKAIEEAMQYEQTTADKYRANIRMLRERYKNALQEPAYVSDQQLTLYSFQTDPDIFSVKELERKLKHFYPVYKIDKATIQKLQGDQPLWIAVSYPYETKERGNQLYEMYTALSQNINYDYIYNYFYDPEKIKGIAYTPANEAQLNARLDAYRKKNGASIQPVVNPASIASGAFFFDDFSSSNEGGEPVNWYYYKTGTKPYTIKTLKGLKGKWLQLGYGRTIKPSLLKTIPTNFKLDFDLATDGNFTGRTGGAAVLTLTSNKLQTNNDMALGANGKGATITLRIESGNEADYNNNYRGVLRVDISNTPELNEENYSKGIRAEYPLTQFTDKKTTVHITLQAQNGNISALVNNKNVIESKDFKMTYGGNCKLCGIAPDIQFTNILFNNVTNDSDNVGVYLSNVKITKQ
jgi:hypothetical protein